MTLFPLAIVMPMDDRGGFPVSLMMFGPVVFVAPGPIVFCLDSSGGVSFLVLRALLELQVDANGCGARLGFSS